MSDFVGWQDYARNKSEARPEWGWAWDGLVGLWVPRLGPTGVTLWDLSGYGSDGTLTNMDPATDWVVGGEGWALDFAGGSEEVIIANSTTGALAFTSGPFTLMTRAVVGATSADTFIAKRGGVPSYQYQFRLSGGPMNLLRTGGSVAASTTPSTGVVHDFGCVVNADGTGTFYLDGASDGTFANKSMSQIATPVVIGNLRTGTGAWCLTGSIISTAIYNRALSAGEIAKLHQEPLGLLVRQPRYYLWPEVAAAAAGNIPEMMRHYRNLRMT
jgi:hypothetical protein